MGIIEPLNHINKDETMNSKQRYLKEESNNITRRFINQSLNYCSPECEEIQSDSIELIDKIEETIKSMATKYKISEEKIRRVFSHFTLNQQ